MSTPLYNQIYFVIYNYKANLKIERAATSDEVRNAICQVIRNNLGILLYASRRNVTLTELDLRWGITEDEAKSGKVLEICFNEIENSVPFFIGIIGNRYGWRPNISDINIDVFDKFEAIKGYIEKHLSVTEMEMQFGVLERAFPQVQPENAAKLRIYPMNIEPRADLPSDMKEVYNFEVIQNYI